MLLDKITTLLLVYLFKEVISEGEECTINGAPGICRSPTQCPSAGDSGASRHENVMCSYKGADVETVCCLVPDPDQRSERGNFNKRSAVEDDDREKGGDASDSLVGETAREKCKEYQARYIDVNEASTNDQPIHSARCDRLGLPEKLASGGPHQARLGEFPHMALLGYGDDPQSASWLCGGSLISDRFILTAGHCTSSHNYGYVSFIRLGAVNRTDVVDASQLYKVKRIIKHPEHKSPKKYNDIALLETETQVEFGDFVAPACLDVDDTDNFEIAVASGWWTTELDQEYNDIRIMEKLTRTKFTEEECSTSFPPARNLPNGVNFTTMLCYGAKSDGTGICSGGGGGPLQTRSERFPCMYNLIGVSSFGRRCVLGQPDIYTRVKPYVPWIESTVWAS